MTCTELLRAVLAYPDWLTTLGLLFVTACFGASVAAGIYEYRYRVGIDYQKRQQVREQMYL